MTKEVAKALNNLSNRINEVSQRLDNYFKMLHDNNAENIEINTVGIDDLAATVDSHNQALDDLANALTDLTEG